MATLGNILSLRNVVLIAALGMSTATFAQPVFRKPAANAAVYLLKNGTNISKESDLKKAVSALKGSKYSYNKKEDQYTWDLKGGILDGKNQRGNGGQSEDQEPLMRVRLPLIIRNGFIRNAKDGPRFSGPDAGVRAITWLNVGEDAVSTLNGAYNFSAIDCEVTNGGGGDKSFQFNEAKGLVVENNVIYKGVTGMRIGDSKTTAVSDRAYVKNNKFISVDTAYHASKITVEETGPSVFEKVSTQWKFANGAKRIKFSQ